MNGIDQFERRERAKMERKKHDTVEIRMRPRVNTRRNRRELAECGFIGKDHWERAI